MNPAYFFKTAFFFEANLAIVAIVLGWFVDVTPYQYLCIDNTAISVGLLGTLPLFLLFIALYVHPIAGFEQIKQTLIDTLGGHLAQLRWYHMLALAAAAGFGEELLFRGTIQPWLENLGGYQFGLLASNVIFGMVHAISRMYAIITGLVGVYLGYLMDVSGERNLLAPIITHGLYDFLAFLVVANTVKNNTEENKL
ncbi:MAG TPA: CPBP family intramembrane metalloprotease [Crenotrichaceae bacterium]|nr:CPBP family intramembrane metalloprotease [Crenotrichaceae bacterium]